MKKTRRSVAITLLLALAIVGVFGVAIAGFSGSSNGGSASSEKSAASHAKNASLKTLNVGSDLYPPFVYSDEYGNIVGLDVEILTEALARIGYKPKYQLIDWEKKKELLANGELDCVMGSFSMTGRENEYRWAGPYLASRQVVAVDPESDIYTLADLKDKVVAVRSTTKPEGILLNSTNENVPQIKELYSFSDRSYLNPALVEGLVDAIASHESSLLTYEKDYGVTYRILDEPLLEVGLGTAFDINDTRGIDVKLTHAYQEMLADGTMERLVSKYFDDPSPFLNVEGLS
ncbi:Histidine-binding periplasmic protein precursor [Collinsella aerofaciens]|uniref:Histidine-binding periplasmic protein n=1 Tax=Collinsella aerofaciens TaxID=74426 RepID=A0A6N2ZXN1_9ACTN